MISSLEEDLFAELRHPPANFSDTEIADHLAEHWGIRGQLTPLKGERDQNICITAADGKRYLLKISNSEEDPAVTNFQTEAFLHVARVDPELRLSRPIADVSGGRIEVFVRSAEGVPHLSRLFTWIEGVPLSVIPESKRPDNPEVLGDLLARLALVLKSFNHPAADRYLPYDCKQAGTLAPLMRYVEDPHLLALVEASMRRFNEVTKAKLDSLPRQIIFNDLSPRNYIVNPEKPYEVTGIIDFGDMVRSARIFDIGVGGVYWVRNGEEPLSRVERFVGAYHRRSPLTAEELDILPDVLRARAMILPLVYSWRVTHHPESREYITHNMPQAIKVLQVLSGIAPEVAAARFKAACGLA